MADSNVVQGQYAELNGLKLYYEVHGSGAPLFLLHGGANPSDTFGPTLTELAKTHQVFAVHLQGHGHTPDIDRPLRREFMAADVAALIELLGLNQALVMGYSMGAAVALQLAIQHPALVRRLVLVSTPMRRADAYPEAIASFDNMSASAPQIGAALQQSPLAQLYPAVDWTRLFTKLGEMVAQDYDWSDAVAALPMPVMLVFADADCWRPEGIVAFYRQLGGGQRDGGMDGSGRPAGQLAIVPGTTHYTLMATPLVAQLVAPFLLA
ncbi:alpha/beta fold hydrolase [Herpetosiphon giganteus]|uniref:alpha/beta fold hydrolase n=1 Tax=Herpetosiphon giganteus TaxID=2029754 RepID=UPI00195D5B07|nr:alpha/beta hydrolase [Herpetosiphon giganteus]MBM7844681.1 pimeloyl-ACP methyl ester carboxylesterase [Herpetosiphon giganteus]